MQSIECGEELAFLLLAQKMGPVQFELCLGVVELVDLANPLVGKGLEELEKKEGTGFGILEGAMGPFVGNMEEFAHIVQIGVKDIGNEVLAHEVCAKGVIGEGWSPQARENRVEKGEVKRDVVGYEDGVSDKVEKWVG